MAHPRAHPIDTLIATAEETSRIMWRAYEAHKVLSRSFPEWEAKAADIHRRCLACDERVARLRASRAKAFGTIAIKSDTNHTAPAAPSKQDELTAAEWDVNKLRLLMETHRQAPRTQQDWTLREARLVKALAAAENRQQNLQARGEVVEPDASREMDRHQSVEPIQ